jgi:hypothetical protein
VQFTTSLDLHSRKQEKGKLVISRISYLACALQAALVNTSKPSLAQEALWPKVPCGSGKFSEGESLRRYDIAIGIL